MDDIIEILLEYYQERFNNAENAKGILLGTPEKELRFVAVFGSADDNNIANVDLKEIDKSMNYNGDHTFLQSNPEFFLG